MMYSSDICPSILTLTFYELQLYILSTPILQFDDNSTSQLLSSHFSNTLYSLQHFILYNPILCFAAPYIFPLEILQPRFTFCSTSRFVVQHHI